MYKVKRFNDLIEDPMNFGLSHVEQNTIFLCKSDEWQDGEDGEYHIYLGPCDDENTLAGVEFTPSFVEDLFKDSGITQYELYVSEDRHSLRFDNVSDADKHYDRLVDVLSSYDFKIVD